MPNNHLWIYQTFLCPRPVMDEGVLVATDEFGDPGELYV